MSGTADRCKPVLTPPIWRTLQALFVLSVLIAGGCGGSGGGGGTSSAAVTHTVTVTTTQGGSVSSQAMTVTAGGNASFAIMPAAGYRIGSATGCGGTLSGDRYTTGSINGNCTISVVFQLLSYQITATSGEGGRINPLSIEVTHGSTATFTVTPDARYGIEGVTGCAGTLDRDLYTTGPIEGPCSISATFLRTSFLVAATAGAGGNIGPASTLVEPGGSIQLKVVPDEGHTIAAVVGCDGSLAGDMYTTGPVFDDCEVSATFLINRYWVTASAGSGGTIAPESIEVEHGGSASFLLTPDSGRVVDAVTGCGGALEHYDYTTGPITGDCEILASFREPMVSGILTPDGGTAVDSDVNDPLAPFVSNNSFSRAQVIRGPVTLGGYVNLPGEGAEGRSHLGGDPHDFFRVGLEPEQLITLHISSEDVDDDLDLFLIDSDGLVLDASVDAFAREESVIVPQGANGELYLVVSCYTGSSNYLLTIDNHTPAAVVPMRLSDRFVPGQAIVSVSSKSEERAGRDWASAMVSGSLLARAGERAPRAMLLDLEAMGREIPLPGVEKTLPNDMMLGDAVWVPRARNEDEQRKLETLFAVKALARLPETVLAAPNYLHELHAVFAPDDPLYPEQWHYPQISLPHAWTLSSGSGVVVAVIDSGVFLEHPDLVDRLVEGYDFVLGIPGGSDPGDSPIPPGGSTYHGTHVTGTISAATDNGAGVAGVAFDARVMPLRACTETGCSSYHVEQALRYAAGLPNDSGTLPPETAGVVNLSLGRLGGPALGHEQQLYDELRAHNIIVVASAGNSSTDVFTYPAAYRNVLAVSAVNANWQRAFYSNFGSWIDVAAPGGDLAAGVMSTIADDRSSSAVPDYAAKMGTSMAAPHVAGVLALMRAAVPSLTAQEIENLLRSEAITDDLGMLGRDVIYGHGLINASKAVVAAFNAGGGPVELDPWMWASLPRVNFGATVDSRTVTFSNIGGGELVFGTPQENSGGWLTFVSAASGGQLDVTLSVARTGLSRGVHRATLSVPSSANTVELEILMEVTNLLPANVGLQYVLLLDPLTAETLLEATAESLGDGRQRFRIDGVSSGEYYLVSGSDSDNNYAICDPGESCGAYGGLDNLEIIEVRDRDLDELEFSVGYGDVGSATETAHGPGLDSLRDRRRLSGREPERLRD
jgi:serine protease